MFLRVGGTRKELISMIELTTRQRNALAKKSILSMMHIRRWFPIRYIDNSVITGISRVNGDHVTVIGILKDIEERILKTKYVTYLFGHLVDATTKQEISIMAFGLNYKLPGYQQMIGKQVVIGGKIKFHEVYGYSIVDIDLFSDQLKDMKIEPVFSKIKGISEDKVKKIILSSLQHKEQETVPSFLLQKHNVLEINEAVQKRMFPQSMDDVRRAKARLLYDDMLCLAGHFTVLNRGVQNNGIKILKTNITDQVVKELPFSLTRDQLTTYEQMKAAMLSGTHIRALIQGDVGCGKTIVSFLAMLLMVENGYQAAMMAPTKILAKQHYEKLLKLIEAYSFQTVLISGGKMSKTDLEKISNGTYDFIIGTHGILSANIHFKQLGILIIDEEHKFGVIQREQIESRQKGINSISMSATPIPRTLANALYGNAIQIYNLVSVPQGRKPVITVYNTGKDVGKYILRAVSSKEQVYVVCPAIDADEEVMPGVLTVTKAVKKYKNMFPSLRISELTGEMSPEETDLILNRFRSGAIDVLVSTTVVEVGVDVPNATLIIIQNAERFGLAGLHQLRGRVGRGAKQAYCVLVSNQSPMENPRIQTLCNTNDGFKIAEIDLKYFRKAGDLFGIAQSGFNKYISEMIQYPNIYQAALKDCDTLSSEQLQLHIRKVLFADTTKNTI